MAGHKEIDNPPKADKGNFHSFAFEPASIAREVDGWFDDETGHAGSDYPLGVLMMDGKGTLWRVSRM